MLEVSSLELDRAFPMHFFVTRPLEEAGIELFTKLHTSASQAWEAVGVALIR